MANQRRRAAGIAASIVIALMATAASGQQVIRSDTYLTHKSIGPGLAGSDVRILLHRVTIAGVRPNKGTVLFVHGGGTPGTVSFDLAHEDYSWMAHVAAAGFDTYSVDFVGYGGSTRPAIMSDPCNLARSQQPDPAACPNPPKPPATNLDSDIDDLNFVVDTLRSRNKGQPVALVGWSLGGPRAGGFAARHPGKVSRLVLLAPAYRRNGAASRSANGPAFEPRADGTNTRAEFLGGWGGQVGCPDQRDPRAAEAAWTALIATDPEGARLNPPARRAPFLDYLNEFARREATMLTTPTLMIAGPFDKQVPAIAVKELHEDMAGPSVFVDLGCSGHQAMWEKNRHLLFKATVDWLSKGEVEGLRRREVRLGYPS
jgi:pimeloyl-ACP methyl ester carboxylesterase